jgi:hypothetical protein
MNLLGFSLKLKRHADREIRLLALKEKLKELFEWGDQESAHVQADAALIEYIDDDEVTELFLSIDKWYA